MQCLADASCRKGNFTLLWVWPLTCPQDFGSFLACQSLWLEWWGEHVALLPTEPYPLALGCWSWWWSVGKVTFVFWCHLFCQETAVSKSELVESLLLMALQQHPWRSVGHGESSCRLWPFFCKDQKCNAGERSGPVQYFGGWYDEKFMPKKWKLLIVLFFYQVKTLLFMSLHSQSLIQPFSENLHGFPVWQWRKKMMELKLQCICINYWPIVIFWGKKNVQLKN